MYWNLRIIENTETKNDHFCFIAEVYYKEGKPAGFAKAQVLAENLQDLKDYYRMLEEAFEKPPLNVEDFK